MVVSRPGAEKPGSRGTPLPREMEGVGQRRQPAVTADSDRSQSAGRCTEHRINTDEVQNSSISRVEVQTAGRTPRDDSEGVARSPNPSRINFESNQAPDSPLLSFR